MRFTVLQENLHKALSSVTKAVSVKGSLPVLSNVLLETEKGRLRLAGTNLETGIVTWIGAKIAKEGGITIPAKILLEFVSNLPPVQLECFVENQILTIKSENAQSKFNGLGASEFPSLPKDLNKVDVKFKSKDLSDATSEVYFSSATDETRPILTGILLKVDGDQVTLVGVDGFRLSERKLKLESKARKNFSVVISARTLSEASKLLNDSTNVEMELEEEGNMILFKGSDILVSSRLLEGQFPDYEKIIPPNASTKVSVPTEEFLNAVKLAGVFARGGSNIIKLKMNPGNKELYVSSSASEVGENETRVELTSGEGEAIESAFNDKYLTDLIGNVGSDELIMGSSGSLSPATFKIKGRKDYIHIIMPIRVQD